MNKNEPNALRPLNEGIKKLGHSFLKADSSRKFSDHSSSGSVSVPSSSSSFFSSVSCSTVSSSFSGDGLEEESDDEGIDDSADDELTVAGIVVGATVVVSSSHSF